MIKVVNEYSSEAGEDSAADEFWIQRDILRHSSKFFQTATKDEWDTLRDEKHTVTLSFEDRDAFKAYLHWLHQGDIPCPCKDDLSEGDDHQFLAKLYVIGEELMDVPFKNAILDIIAYLAASYCPGHEAISIIYKGTSAGSPARKLLADFCAHVAHDNDNSWLVAYKEYPHEALVDALAAMTKVRRSPEHRPWARDMEKYHETDD